VSADVAAVEVAEKTEPRARTGPRELLHRYRFGLLATVCYALGGFWVYARLWVDPTRRLVGDGQDHQLFLWDIAHAARSLSHLENPLFSARLNVPDGVNLMANTNVLGLGVPLAPVTLLFGPQVSFAILGVLSLAGTAGAWYYFFSRRLVSSKPAALLAGWLCGFAPGMIAHSPGHLHVIAQFLLPFILLFVLKLAEPEHTVRNGVILGLLITWQVFISEEMLLLAAFGCAGLVAVYAALRWREARAALPRFVTGLAVAAGVAAVLLAYPLWFQFFGPQHVRGLPFVASTFVTDAWAYVTYPGQSVAGDQLAAVHLASNYGEENAFFGWPLMIVVLAGVIWLWRAFAVRVLAITGLVFIALSLGNHIVIKHHQTRLPGPFLLLDKVPVLNMALPTRFSLVVVPILAALLALIAERVLAVRGDTLPTRLLALGTAAAVLVPIAPIPLHGFDPPVTPAFITAGTWRSYVPEGRTLVPVPLPQTDAMDGMRWSAQTNLAVALPRGFFIGPDGTPNRRGVFFAPPRPTATLLEKVSKTGQLPLITDAERQDAVADLKFWRAAVVVLGPSRHQDAVRSALVQLLGSAETVGGAEIWDVRTLVG
jgi:hypothetical protein